MKRIYRGLKRYGHEALRGHVLQTAEKARALHPALGSSESLRALLSDNEVVRFETQLVFDAARLEPGQFAESVSEPQEGGQQFTLYVHPDFEGRGEDLVCLVAYHIPSINYGKMASNEDAEAFGATLLGLEVDDYYARVCKLADELS